MDRYNKYKNGANMQSKFLGEKLPIRTELIKYKFSAKIVSFYNSYFLVLNHFSIN